MAVRRWSRIARMSCLALTVVLVACMGVGTDLVADQKAVVTATLDTTLFPKSIAGTQAAAVVITVDAAQRVERASLKIDAPPGFAAAPDAFALGTVERKTIQKAVLTRTDDHAVDGDRPLVVTLSAATEGTPPVVIAAQTATFSYAAQIAARSYLLLGGIGIALGYALRFFVNILKSLPTPVPAPEEGVAAAGPSISRTRSGSFVAIRNARLRPRMFVKRLEATSATPRAPLQFRNGASAE
jgi:hypothetical protein